MYKHLYSSVVAIALISNGHISLAQNACDIVLKTKAFNTSDIISSENMIDSKRAEFCRGEYSSADDAKIHASSSGLDIGYEGFSIGGSQQDSGTSKHYEVRSSKFCSLDKSGFMRDSIFRSSSVATDTALTIWLACIKLNSGNVYAQWKLAGDSRSIEGMFHFSVPTAGPFTPPKISGVNLLPTNFPPTDIECQILGKKLTAADLNASGLTLNSVDTEFTCSKIGDSKDSYLEINFVASYPLGFMTLSKPLVTCSKRRVEACGVETYKTKQSEWCGSTPNTGTGAVCGIATWKSGKGAVCGVTLVDSIYMFPYRADGGNKEGLCKWKGHDMTTGRIGHISNNGGSPGPYQPNNNEFLECGTYKTCQNETFGPETFKSCADISFGFTNNVCAHEKHGVQDFKECLTNDANGRLCTESEP